jgi:hypothetical protein
VLRTSDIPVWLIPQEPVNYALELKTALSIPLQIGGAEIMPVTMGTLALIETAYLKCFQTGISDNLHEFQKLCFILSQRENASRLVFAWREWMESPGGVQFDLDIPASWHDLDRAAIKFAAVNKLNEAFGMAPEVLQHVYIAFNGFRMMPKSNGKPGEWLFELPNVAGYVLAVCKAANVDAFNALWRIPVSLGSHLCAKLAQSNNNDVMRPPDIEFLKEFTRRTVEREIAGELHPWQYLDPECELSEYQRTKFPELVKQIMQMRIDFDAMKPDEKTAHKTLWREKIKAENQTIRGILEERKK